MTVLVVVSCLGGCGSNGQSVNNEKLTIVTTIFPEYDWVVNILGDKATDADVTMLLDNGVDLHSFQPTAADILKISSCDVFIYVGGESDGWVDDALQEAVNKNMIVINLLEELGDSVKEEEVVEGMQEEDEEHEHHHDEDGDEDEHHHDEDEDEDHDHHHDEDEVEYDEHVWLSLKNAKVLCNEIANKLCTLDAANESDYKANLTAYTEKLDALNSDFQTLVDGASVKTIVFGDRFPFRYFVDDYGLDYYAAFIGCSAETEASFETITFLAQKVDELGVSTVFTIENSDQKIAKTIIGNTKDKNQKILALNSLQSVSNEQIAGGMTYLGLMQENYDTLKEALN